MHAITFFELDANAIPIGEPVPDHVPELPLRDIVVRPGPRHVVPEAEVVHVACC